MTQLEQLTAIISQARRDMRNVFASSHEVDRAIAERLVDKGAVFLPCKVGDTVYQTDGVRIYKDTVTRLIFVADSIDFDEDAIGESIFLTPEAAEKKLNQHQGCRKCRYFVGCECFDGKVCDMYEEGDQ